MPLLHPSANLLNYPARNYRLGSPKFVRRFVRTIIAYICSFEKICLNWTKKYSLILIRKIVLLYSLSLYALCSLKIVQSLGKRESCRKSRVSVLFHVFSPDFDSDKRFRKSVRRYSNVRYRRTIIGRIVRFFHAQFSPFFFFLFSTTIFSNRGCCSTT